MIPKKIPDKTKEYCEAMKELMQKGSWDCSHLDYETSLRLWLHILKREGVGQEVRNRLAKTPDSPGRAFRRSSELSGKYEIYSAYPGSIGLDQEQVQQYRKLQRTR